VTSIARRAGGGLGASFWRLLLASGVSNLGDGIFQVALPLLAVSVTDSPALLAGVTVASRLPWLVFALFAGALVDRVDRRRAMVLVDLCRFLVLAGVAVTVAGGLASIWLLYAVAFGLGVLETVHDTAVQTVVPVVAPRDRLSTANGRLYGVEITMNQFVGPPIGGLIVALSLAAAFGTTAVGYLGAGLILATLAGRFRAERTGSPTSVRTEIAEGVRFLAHHRLLRTLAVIVGTLNFAGGMVWGVFVLYAVAPGPMGLDAFGFGLMLTATAVGSLVGTLSAESIERRIGRANVATGTILALTAQDAALAVSSNPFVVASVMAVGGLILGAFNPVFVSFRQRLVPDRLLGRVVASFRMLALGTLPVGAFVGGVIGEALGLQAVFVAAAVITAVLLPTRLIVNEAAIDAAEAAVEHEAPPAEPAA